MQDFFALFMENKVIQTFITYCMIQINEAIFSLYEGFIYDTIDIEK